MALEASNSGLKKIAKDIVLTGKLIIHIKNVKFVTLDDENYISWRTQVSVVLYGNDL